MKYAVLVLAAFTLASSVVLAAPKTLAVVKASPTPTAAPNKDEVRIIEPTNGATVATKFKVKMAVSGHSIGALGDMSKGKGHHHIIIDGGPIPAGQPVPVDAQHIHFGKGQTETELELKPGKHKLTLQFADGAHGSYGPAMSHTIEITVK